MQPFLHLPARDCSLEQKRGYLVAKPAIHCSFHAWADPLQGAILAAHFSLYGTPAQPLAWLARHGAAFQMSMRWL